MHDTALRIGRLAIETFGPARGGAILEVGSRDVNGSLRSVAPAGCRYIGLDMAAGPGVDLVVEPGAAFPVDDDGFDLVIASSVFEHDPLFWVTFLEMLRKVRRGGYVYLNSPSNGAVHRWPEDHWRFYPDSGKALVRWARMQGFTLDLVESFVADREADIWDDFVAVFRKGPTRRKLPQQLLHQMVPATNIQIGDADGLANARDQTGDMVMVEDLRDRVAQAIGEVSAIETVLAARDGELTQAQTQAQVANDLIAIRESELSAAQALLADLDRKLEQFRHEAIEASHRLGALESELRQRQEETVQAAGEIAGLVQRNGDLQDALVAGRVTSAELEQRFTEANAWVFRLAGERKAAQSELHAAKRSHDAAIRQLAAAHAADMARLRSAATAQRKRIEQDAEAQRLAALDATRLADQKLVERDAQAESVRRALDAARTELTRMGERHTQEERARKAVEQRLANHFGETARLTRIVLDREEAFEREALRGAWLREVHRVLELRPDWWSIMPGRWRRKRELDRLHRHGLFDGGAYLARYPDVAAAGMDPLRHYILHGISEHREI